jgi:hypothetical protein
LFTDLPGDFFGVVDFTKNKKKVNSTTMSKHESRRERNTFLAGDFLAGDFLAGDFCALNQHIKSTTKQIQ